MTRKEMLEILADLQYAVFWPGNWLDIGFTEREIWVNSVGIGYIYEDNIYNYWELSGISKETWEIIKEKILNETLAYDDIKDTSLKDIIDFYDIEEYGFTDSKKLCAFLYQLTTLKDPSKELYAFQDCVDFVYFYDNRKDYLQGIEVDYYEVHEEWDRMDDRLLEIWISRLTEEANYDQPELLKWAERNELIEL